VKKKYTPQIRDIDRAINNLTRYLTNNPNSIETVNGESLVSKKQIAKMLKISRPTLDKWIKEGFITPIKSKFLRGAHIFPPELI
jgi:predicted DNA-binding transcriptional regulator AlpA